IRECHGDLHLGNMALIDGTVTFFDCIEFNPAFRFVDVICELAFVLMDLESRGLFVEANHVLNTYLEYRDDYEGLALLNFYKVYFAMVRAKVALIQSQAKGVPSETFGHDKMPLSQRYVGLAERYLKPPHRYCALMHGVSGSGKTTVARQISAKTGAIQVRSDVERKRIAGLLPNEKSIDTLADSIYTKAFSEKTFRRLEILSQTVLAAGYPVIVDATFLSRKSRAPFEALAAVCGLPCHILNTVANEVSLRKRLEKREKEGGDASEAGVKVMLAQCKNLEGFSESERERVITISSEHILIDDIASALQL
ncbi:MAG: AAA family ATPase, partial [Gammaproteobacteria bacterium]|nr:AAA family ATPase [Gammaproteobacteria bacterium]